MKDFNILSKKAIQGEFLTQEEGMELYHHMPLPWLMMLANDIRKKLHPENKVSWLIDRNVNITNVCISACKFCNYYRGINHPDAYITTHEEYRQKIDEMWRLGGRQLLLQGGLHPKLGMDFYTNLFSTLKSEYPELKLHALGPAEIVHLSKLDGISFTEVLSRLRAAGLDSLPGAGAEILVDRVRTAISKSKCTAQEWLDVMRAAHQLDILTSATMMFGHIETVKERFDHLLAIRQVQSEKPEGSTGFISFIPWPFQDDGTWLQRHAGIKNTVTAFEYIRFIALARIMLPNIRNIQASWLTVGKNTAQICLHAGANDFGSIMIEENVVSVAGATHKFDAPGIQQAIREAGFTPFQRNQRFEEAGGSFRSC
ncbi:MAG: cyclic dehypoxanthinyl futalosine synthase [Bacteroidales bacterium]